MLARLVALTVALGLIAGCARIAESRFNPFNWFGQEEEVVQLAPPSAVEADPRPLIDEVTALKIERVSGGAILEVRGMPARQGYWGGALVPETEFAPENGALIYQFRIIPPREPGPSPRPEAREVVVGIFISDQSLKDVSEIRVVAARNTRSVRR